MSKENSLLVRMAEHGVKHQKNLAGPAMQVIDRKLCVLLSLAKRMSEET